MPDALNFAKLLDCTNGFSKKALAAIQSSIRSA